MSVITQDGDSALMKAAYMGKTAVVVELVKAGALFDLQNTVCPYPIIHDVQEHAYSLVVYNTENETTCTCIYLTKLKVISLKTHVLYMYNVHVHVYTCPNTCHRVHDILIPSVFHFHSLHREETQL